MHRGTTPKLVFSFPENVVLESMREIWVTIRCMSVKKTFKMSDENTAVSVVGQNVVLQLSQDDTLSFTSGDAKVQVRMLTWNDEALCSTIKEIRVKDILENGVIS